VALPVPGQPVFNISVAYPWPCPGATDQPQGLVFPVPISDSLDSAVPLAMANRLRSKAQKKQSGESPARSRGIEEAEGFTEEELASLVSSDTFKQSIQEALNANVQEAVDRCLPNALQRSLPAVLLPHLNSKHDEIKSLLSERLAGVDSVVEQVRVELKECQQAVANADVPMSVDVASGAAVSAKIEELDAKFTALEAKVSPAGSVDGASTPGRCTSASAWPRLGSSPGAASSFSFGSPSPSHNPTVSMHSYTGPIASTSEWDRSPDPGVLVLNCPGALCNRSDVLQFCKELANGCGIPNNHFSVEGSSPGHKYTVRFVEAADLAARHVRTILGAQRKGPGEWEQHTLPTAAGGTTPVYVNADKNNRQVKTEILLKKLVAFLKEQHPGTKVTPHREEALIKFEWRPAVRIDIQSQSCASLVWKDAQVDFFKIDKKSAEEYFTEELGGGGSGEGWSRS